LIGFSLMAANLSGASYLGLAGAGYHDGIAVWNYEWMATLVLVFFAFFILPFYLRSKVNTVPEFLEHRYDRRARYVFSGFTLVTAMFIDSAGALYAGAITARLEWHLLKQSASKKTVTYKQNGRTIPSELTD
jgi:solute:Na+ symporter, SSS family